MFNDYGLMRTTLRRRLIDAIISGGARGADTLAERYANERGIPLHVYPADWGRYGKTAGFRRNAHIVEAADQVVAFWDGRSPGTEHTIALARAAGKPVEIVMFASAQRTDEAER